MVLEPGTRLGHYDVTALLGKGGMGEVWQATGDVRLAMNGAFETTAGAPVNPVVAPTVHLWQRPVPLLVAGLALQSVGGLAGWRLTHPAPPAVTRFEIPLRADESFNGMGRHGVAVSPNGREIVYDTLVGLSLRSLDQVTPVLVAGTNGTARESFFSPDGQWLAYQSDESGQSEIYVQPFPNLDDGK